MSTLTWAKPSARLIGRGWARRQNANSAKVTSAPTPSMSGTTGTGRSSTRDTASMVMDWPATAHRRSHASVSTRPRARWKKATWLAWVAGIGAL